MGDPYELQRFVDAQGEADTYGSAIRELRSGRKRTHWMWFVFPQLRNLGVSPTAQFYGISGLAEAQAYLAHPVLGTRLVECAQVLTALPTSDAVAIFGSVDAQKLQSSMTLFSRVENTGPIFGAVVDHYFGGEVDTRTIDLLRDAAN